MVLVLVLARLQLNWGVQLLNVVVSFDQWRLLTSFLTINEQARSLPTDKLRVVYISVNAAIYFIQVCSIFVFLECFITWFLYIPCCYHNICVWLVCFFFLFPFMCVTYISSLLTFQSFLLCQSPWSQVAFNLVIICFILHVLSQEGWGKKFYNCRNIRFCPPRLNFLPILWLGYIEEKRHLSGLPI